MSYMFFPALISRCHRIWQFLQTTIPWWVIPSGVFTFFKSLRPHPLHTLHSKVSEKWIIFRWQSSYLPAMYNIHLWESPPAFLLFLCALVLSTKPQRHRSSCPGCAQGFFCQTWHHRKQWTELLVIFRIQQASSAVDLSLACLKSFVRQIVYINVKIWAFLIPVKYEIDLLPRASCKCWCWYGGLPFVSSFLPPPAIFASKLALLGIVFLSAIEKSANQLLPGPLFTLIIFKSYFPTMITVEGEDSFHLLQDMLHIFPILYKAGSLRRWTRLLYRCQSRVFFLFL